MNRAERYESLYKTVLDEHLKVFEQQSMEELNVLLDAICESNRIFIIGAGREGIAARSFAMRLMHLGKEVHWLWDDTTPGMKQGDLFIVVNGSGKIGHIDYLLDQAGKTGATRLVITGSPNERTPKEAEHSVFIPACVYKGTDPRVVPSLQPMGNLYEQHLFLLFDVCVIMLEEIMQLTHDEMEARHRNIE